VHVLSSAPPGSAWTFGGSILTFALPMILIIAVLGALWVLYTKPELVPGRPAGDAERPVSYTPVPHQPAAATAQSATAGVGAVAAPEDGAAASAGDDPAAVPEDNEGAMSGDGE